MEVGEKKVIAACKDMVKDAEYRAELRTIKKMCDTFPIGLTPGTCRYRLLGENGYCIGTCVGTNELCTKKVPDGELYCGMHKKQTKPAEPIQINMQPNTSCICELWENNPECLYCREEQEKRLRKRNPLNRNE